MLLCCVSISHHGGHGRCVLGRFGVCLCFCIFFMLIDALLSHFARLTSVSSLNFFVITVATALRCSVSFDCVRCRPAQCSVFLPCSATYGWPSSVRLRFACSDRLFFREAILMMELPRRHAASLKRAAGSHPTCDVLVFWDATFCNNFAR